MEQVEAPKGIYFICPSNFTFTRDRQVGGKTYLKCHNPLCYGRVIMQEGEPFILRAEHNHPPDMEMVEEIRLRNVLSFRSRTEATSLLQIFLQEQVQHQNAAKRLQKGYASVKSMMQRSRNKVKPPVPSSLQEADCYLFDQSYRRYSIELGPQQRTLSRGCRNGTLYFVSPTILEVSKQENNLHLLIDSSFKVVPTAGMDFQLFIIHWMEGDTAYPVVFCLMPYKTRQTYVAALKYTKELFGASTISSVLCDYEVALRTAVTEVFDGVSLRGCWFHYAKNVFLKARQMNINDPVAIQQAMVIPLLPTERISEGLDFVCQCIENDGFTRYMQRQWRNTNISVFGTTSHAVESLHEELLETVGRVHPNFWVFVMFLQKFEHYKCSDLLRVMSGYQESGQERLGYEELNEKIYNAYCQLEDDGNLGHFLSVTSQTVIGFQKLFDQNEPIEEIPDEGDMVPNAVQALEEVPPAEVIAEEDGALQPLVNVPAEVIAEGDGALQPLVNVPGTPQLALKGGGEPRTGKDGPPNRLLKLIRPRIEGPNNKLDVDGDEGPSAPKKFREELDLPEEKHDICNDRPYYTPQMLKTPVTAVLNVENDSNSGSLNVENEISFKNLSEEAETPTPSTSAKKQPDNFSTNRRKPVYQEEGNQLSQAEVDTIIKTNHQRNEQHALQMKILNLQVEQEIEKLKQERIKTEILNEELRIAKER